MFGTRVLFSVLLLVLSVWAKEPNRPECVAPAKPGGGFDLTCKLAQVSFSSSNLIKKPMRVTYLPGGVGVVAYNSMVTNRAKDSNAIVAFSSGTLLNIATGKHGKYDENSVRWLATAGAEYGIIAVRADSPYKDLKDLVQALKANAQVVSIGAGGSIGGQDWLQTALIAKSAGINPREMRYVAFEGGGEALTALLGGHIEVISAGVGEVLPHFEAKKIRILAILADERLEGELLSSIPTAKEQGYDAVWRVVRGYYMAPDIAQKDFEWWVDAFKKLQQTKEFKEQRNQRGLFEFNKSGDELAQYVKEQTNRYRELAREFGLIKQ